MKRLILLISLLISLISNSQITTLYTEDFSNDWKKGAITYGGVSSSQPTDGNWSWTNVGSPDNDGGSASSWDDMAFIDGAAVMSTNGATSNTLTFRWNDVNNGSSANRVDWYSKTITGAYMSITTSLAYAIGNGSGANSVWAYYQIDGGAWILFGSSVNQSTASGTFTSSTLSCNSSIKLKVVAQTRDYNASYVTIDNVQITGCAVVVPSVSISASSNNICTGTSVTFTATPTNGGSSPSYQWKKNGSNVGTNSTTYTNSSLVNGDVITCVMTSNASCANPTTATSNSTTMTVYSSTVGGSVSSNQNVYSGDNPNDITLTGNNGSVVKWTSSLDSLFTSTTDINITNTTLLSGNMGPINTTTYYRAVVKNGVCNTGYSSFVKMSIVSPLPIELLFFKGKHIDDGNLLEWETATETNNDYFTIYRSGYPIDWHNIAKIDGVGTSTFNHYYRYIDIDFLNEISYYYISQTDFDGKYKNFHIISVDSRRIVPELLRITNILGQNITLDTPGIKILYYSDGTTHKIF